MVGARLSTSRADPASLTLLLIEMHDLISGLNLLFPNQARYFHERVCHG